MNEKIEERFLYEDFQSSYEELLKTADKSIMLVGQLRILCIEIYKTLNGHNPIYINTFLRNRQIEPR